METSDPERDAAARPVHRIGALHYDLSTGPEFLTIRYEGEVDSIETAQRWIEHIETALQLQHRSKVLWDSRPAAPLKPEVRAHIWAWLESTDVLRASAIIVESELLRVSANLSGMSGTLCLKAFNDPREAATWLVSPQTARI